MYTWTSRGTSAAGSAFIKLLVEEEGSELAATLWDGCDAAVSSRLAYPEVRAALAAAGRIQRLDTDAQRTAEAAWEGYWAATRAVELTEHVSQHAGHLASEHALRGADAVHLASLLPSARPKPCLRCGTGACEPEPRRQVCKSLLRGELGPGQNLRGQMAFPTRIR